jgi:hypothetical protein
MPIRAVCPGCQRGFSAPDKYAGRTTKCPKCGSTITIPKPEPEPEPNLFSLAAEALPDQPATTLPPRPAAPPKAGSRRETFGIMAFVFLCGMPALELNGFGFGIPFTESAALVCATLGGAVGGFLLCPRPWIAGLAGGLIAGPLGMLAALYYTEHRLQVWTPELVLVQGLASLPGFGIGLLLKKTLS